MKSHLTCLHLSLLDCKVRVMGISAASGAWGRALGPAQLEVPLYAVPREVAVISPAAPSFCRSPFATVALRGEGEWHLPEREVLKARPCHPPQASVVVGSRQQSQKRDRDTPTWSCQDVCPSPGSLLVATTASLVSGPSSSQQDALHIRADCEEHWLQLKTPRD